ncbi:MAG: Smr/MutS family protein [Saccharofermentans sp.]|nr:Smr/MutS family protein [Saccharofermentans sp.]
MAMEIINIEQGRPRVAEALTRLNNGLHRARATGKPFAKIIHGYGSSGAGGAIKDALPRELRNYCIRKVIVSYCPGEDFGPFSSEARDMAARHPEVSRDSDWGMHNDGITIVMFK